jgi:hypothetical protein
MNRNLLKYSTVVALRCDASSDSLLMPLDAQARLRAVKTNVCTVLSKDYCTKQRIH